MNGFLLFYYDDLDDMWHDDGPIFETEDDAKKEIEEFKRIMPQVFHNTDFRVIPNDGKAQQGFRPLDLGDRILYGKKERGKRNER